MAYAPSITEVLNTSSSEAGNPNGLQAPQEKQRTDQQDVGEPTKEPDRELESEESDSMWGGFHPAELDFLRAESVYARQMARQQNPSLPWKPSQLTPARDNAPPDTAWIRHVKQEHSPRFRLISAHGHRAQARARVPDSPRDLRLRSCIRNWHLDQQRDPPTNSLLLSKSRTAVELESKSKERCGGNAFFLTETGEANPHITDAAPGPIPDPHTTPDRKGKGKALQDAYD
jgi:hypothetical protein